MKFLRHLAAVVLVVGVVVVLAMAWQHAGSPGPAGDRRGPGPAAAVARGGGPVAPHDRQAGTRLKIIRARSGDEPGLSLDRVQELVRNFLIVAVVMAVVVAASAANRRRRVARRLTITGTAAGAGPP